MPSCTTPPARRWWPWARATPPLGHKQRRLVLNRLPIANGGRVVAVFQNGASWAILDAGRLEQGLFELELRPVDLAALLTPVADTLRTPETPLRVAAPDVLIVERANPERLRQALENLIGNALRHTPEGVPVVVEVDQETRADGEWVVVSVCDEGPGIAPTLLPTLFERFARGPRSRGLGLGLYLARGIAEGHGGTLTVESRLGAGTTFRLDLPLESASRGR